jgi:hypothetical protein
MCFQVSRVDPSGFLFSKLREDIVKAYGTERNVPDARKFQIDLPVASGGHATGK